MLGHVWPTRRTAVPHPVDRGVGRRPRPEGLRGVWAAAAAWRPDAWSSRLGVPVVGCPVGISRRLGYLPDGISRDARGDEVLVSDRLRLTRERWAARDQPVPVTVTGLERCRSWFGA